MIFNPPYNPKSVSSVTLKAWYRADQGITIATGVSQWNDLSGNGYHLTQGTGGNQPAFESAGFNGQASVLFNGSSSYLQNSGTMANDIWGGDDKPYTCYMVYEPTRSNTVDVIIGVSDHSINNYVLHDNASTVMYRERNGGGGGAKNAAATGGYIANTKYIGRTFFAGTTVTVRNNTTTVINNAALNTGIISCTFVEIGAWNRGTLGNYYGGRIAEFFIYSNQPNATEDLLLGNYLQNRYMIANN